MHCCFQVMRTDISWLKTGFNLCRYCLWILGNENTLSSDYSLWRNLVNDAKERGCFHNADDDKKLAKAIEEEALRIEIPDESESPFKKLSLRGTSRTTATTLR